MPVLLGLILGVVLTVVGAYATTPRKGGLRMSCRLPPLTDIRRVNWDIISDNGAISKYISTTPVRKWREALND